MRSFLLGSSAFALLAFAAAPASAAIVTNGSFETGNFSGWTVLGFGTTPGTGPRVITTGGTNSTGYGDNVPNYQGTHAAYFVDDNALESISQLVTLAAHTTYSFSFGLFATASGAQNPNAFTLTDYLGRNLLSPVAFDSYTNSSSQTQVPVGVWTTETDKFTTGAGGSYLLKFGFGAGPTSAKDVLLDGVSISAVPLPASAPMFGAALLALGAVGYGLKRKKAAAAAA